MSSYTDPLEVAVEMKERNGLGLVRLLKEFDYVLADGSDTIRVAAGYETDFASVPRIARPFFCTMGKSSKAALLHDWLLRARDRRATKVFAEALKVANVSLVGRSIMVFFVFIWTYPDLHWFSANSAA